MKREMMKWFRVIVVCMAVGAFEGCLSVKLDSHGSKELRPIGRNWHCACLWGGFWWCQDPEKVCQVTKKPGDPGFRRVEVSMGPMAFLASVLSLGVVTPVHVECYEMKNDAPQNTEETAIDL